MILQTFFGTGLDEIPKALSPKEHGYLFLIGTLILGSFFILAFAKSLNLKVYAVLVQLVGNSNNIAQKMKESHRLFSTSSILLLVNYLLMSAVCLYLFNDYLQLYPSWFELLLGLGLPPILLLLQLTPPFIVNWITNAKMPMPTITGITIVGLQFTGLLLTVVALLWALNPRWGYYFLFAFLLIVVLSQTVRLFKNSFVLLGAGVSWYYILLYFCTLEILPLFVAFYYLRMNFL
ncbi:MAG: DUF4271 domain-containing protein [Bacteroidota bacterium]